MIMAAKCFVVKTKSSLNKIPKGYTFQVVSDALSTPLSKDVEQALLREGFPANDAHSYASHSNNLEIISKS